MLNLIPSYPSFPIAFFQVFLNEKVHVFLPRKEEKEKSKAYFRFQLKRSRKETVSSYSSTGPPVYPFPQTSGHSTVLLENKSDTSSLFKMILFLSQNSKN